MKSITVASALLALVASAVGQANTAPVPSPLTEDWLLNSAGNNSLFTRWRPRSHFLSPSGWMNDPCGAVYDPATETYHLHYQYHHNHVNWGNISWGHAVSKDLFHWTDVGDWANDSAVSFPSQHYKNAPLSVFTGTTQPVNLEGEQDGTLLTFLTGITYLPTNWKIHYEKGTEIQVLFTSKDAGTSWQEVQTVIPGPPEGWNVTGFRDPSFFPNPQIDAIRGVSEPHYYAVLGSGLKGPNVPLQFDGATRPGFIGPRIPLYTAPASNLTNWSFLGALWEPTANASLGDPDVTGSYGFNFEVSGFFDLPIEGSDELAWFVTMGAEGGNTTRHTRESWALWNRGGVSARANGSVELTPTSGGAIDWGLSYAQASWVDGREGNNHRRVMWGWANEDIAGDWNFYVARAMGYAGAVGLPTELFVKQTHGVQKHDGVDGNEWVAAADGSFTAQTLGVRPLPEVVESLKAGSSEETFDVGSVTSGAPKKATNSVGDSFVLTATLSSTNGTAGIVIAQSPDNSEYTSIVFDQSEQTISVRRDHSSSLDVFGTVTHQGHFTPYTTTDGTAEEIQFTIVYDRSLLEIYVNDRFVLTSRIYPVRDDSTGVSFFAGNLALTRCGSKRDTSDQPTVATWKDVKVWKGLAEAWLERPEDTSSPLRWDSAEETNNYTWWAGW